MFKKQRFFIFTAILAIAGMTTLFTGNAVGQEKMEYVTGNDVKTLLFNQTNSLMNEAKGVQADLLSPQNFGDAMEHYRTAESDLNKGKEIDNIREDLRKSDEYFLKAIETTKLAEVTFPNSLKARKDAQRTQAAKFSSELWTDAEEEFKDAASELEGGDVNKAKQKANEAETLYRRAELEAIKANYLDATRMLLEEADDMKTKKYAPKTLELAQTLVQQAETELNENRYDTDVARNLAQQANYQARHALYLGKTIEQLEDNKISLEVLLLDAEKPLQQIAEQSNVASSFDEGLQKTTNAIVGYIATHQDSAEGLRQDLSGLERRSSLLHSRVAELEQQVGNQEEQKSALAEQIVNDAKTRELFANVERSFNTSEARVLRERNDVIIRLVGLNFPSNTATIEQKSFDLLTKVLDAIDSFTQSSVSVLGYTDSFGSDEQNLELSISRANAVKEYLLANSDLPMSRIQSYGYGESQPITTNDTEAGRATNRRVEVVIHPWTIETQKSTDFSLQSE